MVTSIYIDFNVRDTKVILTLCHLRMLKNLVASRLGIEGALKAAKCRIRSQRMTVDAPI